MEAKDMKPGKRFSTFEPLLNNKCIFLAGENHNFKNCSSLPIFPRQEHQEIKLIMIFSCTCTCPSRIWINSIQPCLTSERIPQQ